MLTHYTKLTRNRLEYKDRFFKDSKYRAWVHEKTKRELKEALWNRIYKPLEDFNA